MKRLIALLLLLCTATAALADPPALILRHESGKIGIMVGLPDTAKQRWVAAPALQPDGAFSGRLVWIDDAGNPQTAEYRWKFAALTPQPTPSPEPSPLPPPQPAPLPPAPPVTPPVTPPPAPAADKVPTGKLLLLCVLSDKRAQTDAQGQISIEARIPGSPLREALVAHSAKMWFVDPQDSPTEYGKYITQGVADGLPRFVVVNLSTSSVVASVPLTTSADAIALINNWGI